ncbi:MAG: type II toxin-antitoxin system Phd/YefM family antitoxin [Thermomicrobiales bacterium]
MRQYKSDLQDLDTVDIGDSLASVVTRVAGNDARVVIEQHGKPVAAIISIEDWRRFTRLEAEREKRFAVLDEARAAFAGVPAEEVEAEFDRALAEVRAKARTGAERD